MTLPKFLAYSRLQVPVIEPEKSLMLSEDQRNPLNIHYFAQNIKIKGLTYIFDKPVGNIF